ncbi:hypothetical protein LTR10_017578 [Elasticomyces elasticus]|uniref:Uncharacterized protein n=1 Tax=Exophiala sideris TaxID=1016849 RepID=A0ABR0IZX6_9EURO|nr:hypothetical protein LTR10_017578 [Elasticomyces elasticus]KAK5023414.1 hypothetical protein LTS07_009289 [Exophiala sideris]KAK5028210.1 hypothetical protein LTR13_009198 [Exophiala sideris]KAK5052868.1 hypothetical protein LTR69_009694 [Exophiala sideris]KAK5178479.1 hypothetical protein LTR44_009104 [Eurotiomycetes sp. CCFEE 6388]
MSLVYAKRLAKGNGNGDVENMYKTSSHRKNAIDQELFPEDIAGLVRFLAGKDSNRLTGQTIIWYVLFVSSWRYRLGLGSVHAGGGRVSKGRLRLTFVAEKGILSR